MQHLKWFLLVVFATIVVEGRFIRPVRERKVSDAGTELNNFAKFKEALKRGCRPRPGSPWCTGKRETLIDAFNKMPPPSSYDAVFAQQERRDLGVENGDLVEKKQCRPRPGSAWCTEDNTKDGKRAFMENDERLMNAELSNETV